jgi:FSR family fosmidomycin resistance protein-like MFS transporter
MNGKKAVIPFLAVGHGLNDLLAGYYLGSIVRDEHNLVQGGLALLIYNLLAFGGQYPVALWLEQLKSPKRFLICGYTLNGIAVAFFAILPHLAVVLMGLASAMYHVAGGSVCAKDNKAANIGLFAAPGVLGLIAGGFFAVQGYQLTSYLLPSVLLFLFFLLKIKIQYDYNVEVSKIPVSAVPDRHDIVMILLLTVISLRSALWNIFQLINENNYEWVLAIGIAAFAGKIAGGWVADRIGWRLYIFISLFSSLSLLTFFKNELLLFCIGIGLLQSGIPATTSLIIQSVKGKTERGISLSFGVAIIAGALVFALPQSIIRQYDSIAICTILIMLLLMYQSGRIKSLMKQ